MVAVGIQARQARCKAMKGTFFSPEELEPGERALPAK
jgi:hypothetical protein